ncbi:T9SS type A sorting domain-containing protein [Catalinimonas alkaloidigena]|nr:T9SS type A sorting domain-containing protein [Catalinimonas alkaloidigena]
MKKIIHIFIVSLFAFGMWGEAAAVRAQDRGEVSLRRDERSVSSVQSGVHIYPNPIVGKAVIEYTLAPEVREAKVMIFNILGNLTKEIALSQYDTKVDLPANELSAGVYFYSLYLDGVRQDTKRLVVK